MPKIWILLFRIYVIQEFPFYIFIFEFAAEIGSAGFAIGVSNTSWSNTHVVRVHYHANVFCLENFFQFLAYLHRKPFLYLRTLREELDNTVNLWKPYNFARWEIRNMNLAIDRNKMMLTMWIEGNILLHQHLIVVVFIVKQPCCWSVLWIESAEYFFHIHLGDPAGSTL